MTVNKKRIIVDYVFYNQYINYKLIVKCLLLIIATYTIESLVIEGQGQIRV